MGREGRDVAIVREARTKVRVRDECVKVRVRARVLRAGMYGELDRVDDRLTSWAYFDVMLHRFHIGFYVGRTFMM